MLIGLVTIVALGGAAFVMASAATQPPHGVHLRVLSAVGMRQVLIALEPQFEQATGHQLTIEFDSTGLLQKRIADGEPFDVVFINATAVDSLVKAERVVASSITPVAQSITALAIKKGAARPDISSTAAFRQTLLSAKSIARPSPSIGGSSGDHIAAVLKQLGITAEVDAKSIIVSVGGPDRQTATPGDAVANGRAEIALHQLQELRAVSGLEIVGPFPAPLQGRFTFSAALADGTTHRAAVQALIDFLKTPHAINVIKQKGMEPQ
jgi:molybdate transport system substrate-binding protein